MMNLEAYCAARLAARNAPAEIRTMLQDTTRLKVSRVGDTVQVEFTSRKILDEANIAEIGEQLTAIVDKEDRPRIIISFAAVDHLSSAALGTLITINNRVREKSGQLRLSDINPQ